MTKYDEKTREIQFDPHDWKGMSELRARADEFKVPCVGKNEEGESVWISINHDNITVQTFQKNGWIRTNVYWDDYNVEETYDK